LEISHALLFYGAIFLVALILITLMIVLCLLKGDVRAGFKIPFVAFVFEAKERRQNGNRNQKQLGK
jgi:hypothetical protein